MPSGQKAEYMHRSRSLVNMFLLGWSWSGGWTHGESVYGRIITLCRLLSVIIINVIFGGVPLYWSDWMDQRRMGGWMDVDGGKQSSKVYAARAVLSMGYSTFNGTSFVCGNPRPDTRLSTYTGHIVVMLRKYLHTGDP